MNTVNEKYMRQTLNLAKKGTGSVEPNPAVGCVIVKNDRVIAKGWHKKFGGPHAEINALADCKKQGRDPAGSTIFVTLEPCCHHGKTGPCTQAIIKAKPAKVVIAMTDPSEHAAGKGIEQLSDAGIHIETGICEKEAKLLNAPFIKFATTRRPWVILKWAQSTDGKLAWAEKTGKRWISNEKSRKDAHKLRRQVQGGGGILVGIETVLADDPLLTARPSGAHKLLRIVLDTKLRIPLDCKLLKTAKRSPVLVVTTARKTAKNSQKFTKITKKGAEILIVPPAKTGCDLKILLDELGKKNISQLLVEGGAKVITSFLNENLADQIVIYIAPDTLASNGKINITKPMARSAYTTDLDHIDIKHFDNDIRITKIIR